MAANVRTEMRIPTRSAPRPPSVNTVPQRNPVWGSSNDVFGSTIMPQAVQKKKPPPRPPPPKFNQNYFQNQRDQRQKKAARPTELLTNFFGRKKQEHPNVTALAHVPNTILQPANTHNSVCLIDFSPPGSPTFTTRSSSDGVSVDSFGSDGNSNPSAFTSSGNTSQTESAFEDDFDFFGISTKKAQQNDPWKAKTVRSDPFGPIETYENNTSQNVRHAGESCFFTFNTNQVPSSQANTNIMRSMPTIIRAKPPKPPAPKVSQTKVETKTMRTESGFKSLNKTTVPFTEPISLDLGSAWTSNMIDNPSPPMPTIPPPVPPLEYLTEMDSNAAANNKEPYGIALFDFPVTHPDDLPLKEGDIVHLIKNINDDWMEGRVGNRQGMFPTNFISIKVPLPGTPDNVVTAMYSFKAETVEDLSFEEGAKITVLSRLSDEWLYGECGGRKGQFPANYVSKVPFNIPRSF
ncbi:hypothetical protein KM043_004111 [Ampulex compressa]|nr:hypothetical protein KM043_004111 [Ampulex compressa]